MINITAITYLEYGSPPSRPPDLSTFSSTPSSVSYMSGGSSHTIIFRCCRSFQLSTQNVCRILSEACETCLVWKMGNPHRQWSSRATKLENTIWAIRLLLICVGIASCVALLKAAVIPYASTFVVDTIPGIWNSGKVLFSPPYVYIIANCIIIAIAASTSFHHQNHLGRKPERRPPSLYSQKSQVLEAEFTEKDETTAEDTVEVIKQMITESDIASNTSCTILYRNPLNRPRAVLSGNPSNNSGATLRDRATLEEPGKKSPESEDGKLPDEQEDDTMDSIWKEIMEGQGKQPTAQLKKSDTWETAARRTLNNAEPGSFGERTFRKSETFRERTTASNATVSSVVAKEKSMGQDELKLRIEAFIRKNYDDMRLQREESGRQFV